MIAPCKRGADATIPPRRLDCLRLRTIADAGRGEDDLSARAAAVRSEESTVPGSRR